jgi:hypothetical protein
MATREEEGRINGGEEREMEIESQTGPNEGTTPEEIRTTVRRRRTR